MTHCTLTWIHIQAMQNTAREIFLMRDFKLPREGLWSIFSWWGSHANWGLEALESCKANRKSQILPNNLSLSPHSKTSCSILSQPHFPHYNQSRTCLWRRSGKTRYNRQINSHIPAGYTGNWQQGHKQCQGLQVHIASLWSNHPPSLQLQKCLHTAHVLKQRRQYCNSWCPWITNRSK